jgi:osmoprotectant transport system substrate-binding protein
MSGLERADEVRPVRGARAVVAAFVAAALPAILLAGCTEAGRSGGAPPRTARSDAVVVASFDFPESRLVAEIYAQALAGTGVPVRREEGLGPRELVAPALAQGLADLVPEYLGSALAAIAPRSAAGTSDAHDARLALDAALRARGLRTLTPSPGQNQNVLAVTAATARHLGLRRTSDLRGQAPLLRLGAPPECPSRPYCLVGLRKTYGLQFGTLVPLDSEPERVAALREGVVDVALLFTTDGSLAAGDLVALRDDRHLQPAENLVPVVSTRAVLRYGGQLTHTLDQVSAALTTANLRFLNWRVQVAGKGIPAEARGWLLRHGLLTRSR